MSEGGFTLPQYIVTMLTEDTIYCNILWVRLTSKPHDMLQCFYNQNSFNCKNICSAIYFVLLDLCTGLFQQY